MRDQTISGFYAACILGGADGDNSCVEPAQHTGQHGTAFSFSASVCVSVFLFVYVCACSFWLSVCLELSLSLSLCFSVSLSRFVCLSLSKDLCIYLSLLVTFNDYADVAGSNKQEIFFF